MQGFITETELGQADEVFPGIVRFFESLAIKPRTFLELVSLFDHWIERREPADAPEMLVGFGHCGQVTPLAVR